MNLLRILGVDGAPAHERVRQALLSVAVGTALIFVGALGYHRIEGWSWNDSFYMVFITLSTVGFSEVHPLSSGGRVFTIFLVVCGVSLFGYMAAHTIEFLTEGSLRGYRRKRRMAREIDSLENHYVVCGYGRVGRQVVDDFLATGRKIIVIDREDPEGELETRGILHIIGNAEHEAVLERAGIRRAAGLVAAVDSDTENVFITLTAKQMNPTLRVIARASNEETARKLSLVGAERVVSPYVASGRRMAHLAIRPHAVDFFDVLSDPLQELNVEVQEVEIREGSPLAGKSLRELNLRRSTGVIVVALRQTAGIQLNPDPDAVLEPGAHLLAMGTADQCKRLEELVVTA